MATTLDCTILSAMLQSAARLLRSNQAHLSQLDSATGDGDHGATMSRVADAIEQSATSPHANARELFNDVGWSVLSVDGGSASPLVGSFLMGIGEALPEADALTSSELAAGFEAGLANFRRQTAANVGDKTMLDALVPAVEALRSAADVEADPAGMFAAAAHAASTGANSTKSMQARFGRAKNLGARSIGVEDPGAVSISLMFSGFQSALTSEDTAFKTCARS